MATAKQKAWRKKFAAMAKNGTLKKKRKTAKKKTTKRKTAKKKSKLTKCAVSLGKRGGKKTYAKRVGIFSARKKRKKKKTTKRKTAKKKTSRKRVSRGRRSQLSLF